MPLDQASENHGASPATETGEPVPPMTATLMARLFVVPAIIVCVLLAVAVVIVLFGTTTSDKPVSIATLLDRLDHDDGERTLDVMLMPQAKDSWQAAQELARRLADRDKFLTADEIEPTAQRIVKLIEKFGPGKNVNEAGPAKQYFLMLALARLGTPTAIPTLTALLKDPNASTRQTALQALADMRGVPGIESTIDQMLPLLSDPNTAVQIVACAAVGGLANPQQTVAVNALRAKLDADREIQWNAAIALAHLGNRSGKMVLMNMLDRSYWEAMDLSYDDGGTQVQRKYTEAEISRNLTSAIEAAARLADSDLTSQIAALESDKAHAVRDAARAARAEAKPVSTATGRNSSLAGKLAMAENS